MRRWAVIVALALAFGLVVCVSLVKREPRVVWVNSMSGLWPNSAPSIGREGVIYFGGLENNFCALSRDGSLLWKTRIPTNATPFRFFYAPVIATNGTIFVGTSAGELVSLGPEGQVRWTVEVAMPAVTSAAIGSDNVTYIGTTNREPRAELRAYNEDGSVRWTFKSSGEKTGNPVLGADGTIYFGCSASNLYALNRDGALKWTCPNAARFFSHPIVGPDGTIYSECYPRFHAIRPDGTIKWSFINHMPGQSAVLNESGTLFICDSNGIVALEAATGKALWKHRVRDYGLIPSRGLALARDGTIYFSGDRTIEGIDRKGRTRFLFRRDPNPDPEAVGIWKKMWNRLFNRRRAKQFYPCAFTLTEDDRLYAFMPDRKLYALEVPAGLATNAPWPMFKRDVRHTSAARSADR